MNGMEWKNHYPIVITFLKFVIVGAIGLFIDFALTYVCKEIFRWNKYVANAVGFFVAASNNFLINRAWTFANTAPPVWEQYAKFILFAWIGLWINSAIIWFLHDQRKSNFYVSKIVATIMVTVWNFTSNILFTFQ